MRPPVHPSTRPPVRRLGADRRRLPQKASPGPEATVLSLPPTGPANRRAAKEFFQLGDTTGTNHPGRPLIGVPRARTQLEIWA